MIHPFTKINVLDLKSEYNFHGRIDKLLNQYVEYIEFFGDGSSLLDCRKAGLYMVIQDWTGWTYLESIAAVIKIDPRWYHLTISQDNIMHSIITTKEELIPVYDPNQNIRGFHGETKFLYQLKEMGDLVHGDTIRHRDLTGPEDDYPQQFGSVFVAEPFVASSYNIGYEIETLSGFYNGNRFHLAANNVVAKTKDASYK